MGFNRHASSCDSSLSRSAARLARGRHGLQPPCLPGCRREKCCKAVDPISPTTQTCPASSQACRPPRPLNSLCNRRSNRRVVPLAAKKQAPRGDAMFEILDRRTSLTRNQIKILSAAIIGDALEFFDYFLIGFVLAFLIGPWKLTFGQSATVLMSSGIGAIIGAYVWGWLADRIGRRVVFIGTVLNFSLATGLLYFTPDNGWIYLTILRFFVGTGVGGLYCVDLPLVQEFMPSSKRGWVGGLVTCVIPLGVGLGAVLGAFMGSDQWRLLFAIGVLPSLLVLLVRIWVPESPRWLCRQGRYEEARKSLAWALQVEPSSLPLPTAADAGPVIKTSWLDLFKYPRSLIVSWLRSEEHTSELQSLRHL